MSVLSRCSAASASEGFSAATDAAARPKIRRESPAIRLQSMSLLLLAGYAGCNEISCSLFAPKDEKWRASSVAAYCRATRRSRVALNFWRAVDPANEIDQSTLSEPRIVSAGVRFPDAGMNA